MKRHYTRDEIIAQCKQVARERRMCDRTPWTAAGIICGYALMTSEGYKGQRISNVVEKINEYEEQWQQGNVDVKQLSSAMLDRAGFTIESVPYSDKDIKKPKRSFDYWIQQKQIDPQNAINEMSTRYMLFFFTALMELYGFGEKRLVRIQEQINKMLLDYQVNKTTIKAWKLELLEKAGVVYEMPIDPLTQSTETVMC